jgi:hypothetical protein
VAPLFGNSESVFFDPITADLSATIFRNGRPNTKAECTTDQKRNRYFQQHALWVPTAQGAPIVWRFMANVTID